MKKLFLAAPLIAACSLASTAAHAVTFVSSTGYVGTSARVDGLTPDTDELTGSLLAPGAMSLLVSSSSSNSGGIATATSGLEVAFAGAHNGSYVFNPQTVTSSVTAGNGIPTEGTASGEFFYNFKAGQDATLRLDFSVVSALLGLPTGVGTTATPGSFLFTLTGGSLAYSEIFEAGEAGFRTFNLDEGTYQLGTVNFADASVRIGSSPGAASLNSTGTFLFDIAEVPEPSTWAMMLVGFGAVGYSFRRRPRHRLAQAV